MKGVGVVLYNIEYEALLEQYVSPQERARSAIASLWNVYTRFPDVLNRKCFRVYLSDELYGMLYDMAKGRYMSTAIRAGPVFYNDVRLVNFYKKKLSDLRGWR